MTKIKASADLVISVVLGLIAICIFVAVDGQATQAAAENILALISVGGIFFALGCMHKDIRGRFLAVASALFVLASAASVAVIL